MQLFLRFEINSSHSSIILKGTRHREVPINLRQSVSEICVSIRTVTYSVRYNTVYNPGLP